MCTSSQRPTCDLEDVFVGVLVLESVVFKGWDHLLDHTHAYNRAWNYFWELPCLCWEGEIPLEECAWHNKAKLKYSLQAGACICKEHGCLCSHDRECKDPHLCQVHIDYTHLVCIPPHSITVDVPLIRGCRQLITLLLFTNPELDSLEGCLQMADWMLHLCRQVTRCLHGAASASGPCDFSTLKHSCCNKGKVY